LLAALADLGGPGAHISVLAHSVAQPPEFEGAWFDAPGERALRAATVCQPARTGCARGGRDMDRSAARWTRLGRHRRPPAAGDASEL